MTTEEKKPLPIEVKKPQPIADLPDVLTKLQAADALGVDPRTIDRYAAQGRIRKVKLSPGKTGAARFLKADLLALLERGAA